MDELRMVREAAERIGRDAVMQDGSPQFKQDMRILVNYALFGVSGETTTSTPREASPEHGK